MEYEVEIDFGSGGICPVTIEVDDSYIEEYAKDHLGMIDEGDAEEWTHENVSCHEWLDKECDPDAALHWVLENVPHERIIEELEKEMRG